MKEPVLSHSYTTVHAVALIAATTSVPERNCQNFTSTLSRSKLREDGWLKVVLELLETKLEKRQRVTWAAYHATLQPPMVVPPAITALLPLFCEHADSPAMIKHGMEVIKDITEYLNPGQFPVMAPVLRKQNIFSGHGLPNAVVVMLGVFTSKWRCGICLEIT